MWIQLQEPPKRRLRIQSRTRFIVFILFIVLAITAFVIPGQGRSNVEYKPYRIGYGDTYWHIVWQLQEAGYRPRADIRILVPNLEELK